MSNENGLNDLLTVEEVIELLGVHRVTLQNWRKQGKLRALKLGPHRRLVRFKRQDIEALLSEEQDLDGN